MIEKMIYALARVLLVPCLAVAQVSVAGHEEALQKLSEFSENYGARLHDFSCNKLISRQASRPGKPKDWSDTSEEEIDYVARIEARHLVSVDGVPAKGKTRPKHGYVVAGEFGMLGRIFSRKADADFTWLREDDSGEQPVCTFGYRIRETASPIKAQMGHKIVMLSHHGEISAYCATGVVVRLDAASDPEPDKGVELSTSVRFAPATIAGKIFQLPVSAVGTARFDKEVVHSTIQFRNYRKYDASSAIRFGEEEVVK